MAGLGVGMGGQMSRDNADTKLLHACIHNHFISEGHPDLAKAILDSGISIDHNKLHKENKQSNRANGADDAESKDDTKNGLVQSGDNFLLDYWGIFWDVYNAARDPTKNTNAAQLLQFNQQRNQMRQNPQMYGHQLMPQYARVLPGNMNLQKNVVNNNAVQRNMNQQQQFARVPNMGQQQMQRDGSGIGDERQSPNSNGDNNAPSPKRARVDGAFNPQQMQAARGPMPNQMPNGGPVGNQDAIMMQNADMNGNKGMNHGQMQMMSMGQNPHFAYSQAVANQQKQGLMNAQNGPSFNNQQAMSPQVMNSGFDLDTMGGARQINPGPAGPNNGANSGGGALADYQMQLMLLEQQNKKRLMMARQEHDVHQNAGMPNQQVYPMNISPHVRNGTSPANDAKRKSPMDQSSPLPDRGIQNRNSPGIGNFDQAQGGMNTQHFIPQIIGGPGGGNMRPPSSHPIGSAAQAEMMRNGRLPNANWQGTPMQGGQMMAQVPGGPQNQTDNQAQRGAMPPPQVPAAGGNKPQPSPTHANAQPPTPSGGPKASTKKKDTKESKKAKLKKGQSTTNATPNPDADRQPTPTPQTPATPVAPESHIIKGQPNQNQVQQNANGQILQQQQQQQQQQPNNIAMPPNHGMDAGPFGIMDGPNEFADFNFINDGTLPGEDANDILGGFDFDTFLVNNDGGMDWSADFSIGDGLESGAGQ